MVDPLLRWLADEERLEGPRSQSQSEGALALIHRLLTQPPVLRVRLAACPAAMGRAAWVRRRVGRAALLGRAAAFDCDLDGLVGDAGSNCSVLVRLATLDAQAGVE